MSVNEGTSNSHAKPTGASTATGQLQARLPRSASAVVWLCAHLLHTVQKFWALELHCIATEAAMHGSHNVHVQGVISCCCVNTAHHMSWLGRRGATSTVSCR
jgi:hypothetical protein